MRRTVHVVLCLVLFTAFMEGLRFLAGDGISREFGVGVVFGGMLGLGMVALVTDRDYIPPYGALGFLVLVVATSIYFGLYLRGEPWNAHLPLGAFVGFGVLFPMTYWAVGNEREQRGFPRPPLFQRAAPSRRR